MRTVAEALDRQEIRHMLGGSIGRGSGTRLLLGRDFYMDTEAASDALRRGRSFNMIHFASSYKFDIFPVRDDPYSRVRSVKGNCLDRSYLDTWAKTLRVDDLLQRLLNEETP
jgi:hypothetical protein